MEIVLNVCYGGFSLSKLAIEKLHKNGLVFDSLPFRDDISFRLDQRLIDVVRELGKKADGPYTELHIYTIPEWAMELRDRWSITDYDGIESLIVEII